MISCTTLQPANADDTAIEQLWAVGTVVVISKVISQSGRRESLLELESLGQDPAAGSGERDAGQAPAAATGPASPVATTTDATKPPHASVAAGMANGE